MVSPYDPGASKASTLRPRADRPTAFTCGRRPRMRERMSFEKRTPLLFAPGIGLIFLALSACSTNPVGVTEIGNGGAGASDSGPANGGEGGHGAGGKGAGGDGSGGDAASEGCEPVEVACSDSVILEMNLK